MPSIHPINKMKKSMFHTLLWLGKFYYRLLYLSRGWGVKTRGFFVTDSLSNKLRHIRSKNGQKKSGASSWKVPEKKFQPDVFISVIWN